MVESGNRVLSNQQQVEEQWERDDVAITAKLLWFFARYNLLHLCGIIGPAPYLKPRGLVRLDLRGHSVFLPDSLMPVVKRAGGSNG